MKVGTCVLRTETPNGSGKTDGEGGGASWVVSYQGWTTRCRIHICIMAVLFQKLAKHSW